MDIPPTPGTPQFVGTVPTGLELAANTAESAHGGKKCSKSVCKVIVPALVGIAIVLLIIVLVRVFNKHDNGKSPTAPALQYARPYPRNIPAYPARVQAQPAQQGVPQAYTGSNGNGKFSAYQSSQQPTSRDVTAMLENRYHQTPNAAYNDSKMPAYDSYSAVVGNQGQVQSWTEEDFNKKIVQQKTPALVAFLMQGCSHCTHLAPNFAEAAKYAKIPLVVIERGSAGALIQKYGISGYPTVILFQNGEAIRQYNGDRSAQSLADFANA